MKTDKRRRIAFLGPAPPFRGGISQFAVHLAEALSRDGHIVKLFNFVQQYPALIFPGSSQLDEKSSPVDLEIEACFTPYLPWTWATAVKAINAFEPDLLIVSYWLPFFAPASAWISSRVRGSKIVYLAHNVESHEKWLLSSWLRKWALSTADRIVLLSKSCHDDLKRLLPNRIATRGLEAFHPVYDHPAASLERQDDKPRILFFGLIKAYKGLDLLLEAMALLKERMPELELIVAGDVYGSFDPYQRIIDKHGISGRVELHLRYISDDEIAKFFMQSQLCVLPYRSATQSGVIASSYSFDVPVAVTQVGGLTEYIEEGKTGISVPPEDPAALADAIFSFYEAQVFLKMQGQIREYKKQNSWQELAKLILKI